MTMCLPGRSSGSTRPRTPLAPSSHRFTRIAVSGCRLTPRSLRWVDARRNGSPAGKTLLPTPPLNRVENHYRVLLVEDLPVDARLIQIVLGEAPDVTFDLKCAERLSDAFERLGSAAYDVVLLDLSLPDSLGFETFRALHARFPSVPIVVLSGLDDEQLALRAVHAGAQDYLVKGRDTELFLVRAIRYAVERFRASQKLREREEHLRLLTQQLPCVFWTTNDQLRLTSSAGAALGGLDLHSNDVIGKTLYEVFDTDNPELTVIAAHQEAARGESRAFEMRWKGRLYHVQVEPFRQSDGTVTGTIGVALDVTDQMLVKLELRVARQIQQDLRPAHAPASAVFDIAGASYSADAAGGDFYDYIEMPDGQIGLVIGDVAGNGLGPAMQMCQTRAYLRALARTQSDIGEVVTRVNDFLCTDSTEQRLVALMFVKIDSLRRQLQYAAAGHRGHLLHADGSEELLDHTGIPLNIDPRAITRSTPTRDLHTGDILVLYTDGIVESADEHAEPFGIARMLDVIRENGHRPALQIVESLFAAVRDYAPIGSQKDDMTAVLCKVA